MLSDHSDAIISTCGKYRYSLTRNWPAPPTIELKVMNFIMLNPSTADSVENDPTILRCIHFAKREKYAGIRVLNLFAYRTPYPDELERTSDPIGPKNDLYLESCQSNEITIVAWGAKIIHGKAQRVAHVLDLLKDRPLWCLGKTKDGSPKHPLYLRNDTPLIPF